MNTAQREKEERLKLKREKEEHRRRLLEARSARRAEMQRNLVMRNESIIYRSGRCNGLYNHQIVQNRLDYEIQ